MSEGNHATSTLLDPSVTEHLSFPLALCPLASTCMLFPADKSPNNIVFVCK